jgi:hypothetical protein
VHTKPTFRCFDPTEITGSQIVISLRHSIDGFERNRHCVGCPTFTDKPGFGETAPNNLQKIIG